MSEELDPLSLESTVKTATEFPENNRIKTGIGRTMIMETEVPHWFTPLTNLEKGLPALEHNFTSAGTQICRKSAFLQEKTCKWCLEKDRFDKSGKKTNKAKSIWLLPIYMFNSVGNVIEYDKKDGTHVGPFPDNPIQFISLPRGVEDCNIDVLKEYNREGELTSTVFEIKKFPKEQKKAMSAVFADKKKVDKKFAHIGGCNVPQEILEDWANKTKEEVRGLGGNCYGLFSDEAPKIMFDFLTKPEPLPDDEVDEAKSASELMDG